MVLARVIISLGSNVITGLLSLITSVVLARALGPEEYGVFAFLLASFSALLLLLDMGTSKAFFTFLSRKNRSRRFIHFYLIWMVCQFIVAILLIQFFFPDNLILTIWEGESRHRVLIAFIAIFLQQQVWASVTHIGESQRFTARVQVLNILIAVIHLAIISVLFQLDAVTVDTVYYFIIAEILFASFMAYIVFPVRFIKESDPLGPLLKEYWVYCLPLIPFVWGEMIKGFADTWLLQHYGGSVEQAYFAIAFQFSAVSMIATRSVLNILWKEVAELDELNDKDNILSMYERITRILVGLSAVISGFLIPFSAVIVQMTLGDEYVAGAFSFALMLLYPIHQSIGQVNGVMFMALGLTRQYFLVSILILVVSLLSSYFLLAPSDALIPGLGLGSVGMVLKRIFVQFLGVNISILLLCRIMGWKYDMRHQFFSMAVFLPVGYLSYYMVEFLLSGYIVNVFARMISCGALYLILVVFVSYLYPSIFGLNKKEVNYYLNRFIRS